MQLASPWEGREQTRGHCCRWKSNIKNTAQLAQHEHQSIDTGCQWLMGNNIGVPGKEAQNSLAFGIIDCIQWVTGK